MSKKRAQRAIDYWLETKDNTLLINEKPFLEKMWAELSQEENDVRPGIETYGYGDDEDVTCQMEYISDRWMCAFRLKWIIDGLENGRI